MCECAGNVLEAKALLKYSVMSIQEVAYFMNFPNPSFFGLIIDMETFFFEYFAFGSGEIIIFARHFKQA